MRYANCSYLVSVGRSRVCTVVDSCRRRRRRRKREEEEKEKGGRRRMSVLHAPLPSHIISTDVRFKYSSHFDTLSLCVTFYSHTNRVQHTNGPRGHHDIRTPVQ